jgi:hypothetical protein
VNVTLTSFNSFLRNLTEFIAVDNLVALVTVEHKTIQAYSLARLTSLLSTELTLK